MIDIQCKVGKRLDCFTRNRGHGDFLVSVTETGGFVDVQFQLFGMRHQIDNTIDNVIHAAGKLDVTFA